jgi:hypothetical protein
VSVKLIGLELRVGVEGWRQPIEVAVFPQNLVVPELAHGPGSFFEVTVHTSAGDVTLRNRLPTHGCGGDFSYPDEVWQAMLREVMRQGRP